MRSVKYNIDDNTDLAWVVIGNHAGNGVRGRIKAEVVYIVWDLVGIELCFYIRKEVHDGIG